MRFQGKSFIKKLSRGLSRECENLNLDLARFAEIALKAMQGIAPDLGL
jgi:predicted hydrolase (HD superfamily)